MVPDAGPQNSVDARRLSIDRLTKEATAFLFVKHWTQEHLLARGLRSGSPPVRTGRGLYPQCGISKRGE
jgi:hypothetical protein